MNQSRLDALVIAEEEAGEAAYHARAQLQERRNEEAAARNRTNLAAERVEVLRIEAEVATQAREEAEITLARKEVPCP